MNFETLQRVLGKEAEPDWVQFQSFVFVHTVLLRVDVECFLDSPLQTWRSQSITSTLSKSTACCSKIACSAAAADMSNRPFLTKDACSLTRTTSIQAVRPVSSVNACSQSPHLTRYATPGSSSWLVRSFSCCWSDHFQFLGFPTTLTFRGLKILCRGWITPSINGTSTVVCRRVDPQSQHLEIAQTPPSSVVYSGSGGCRWSVPGIHWEAAPVWFLSFQPASVHVLRLLRSLQHDWRWHPPCYIEQWLDGEIRSRDIGPNA